MMILALEHEVPGTRAKDFQPHLEAEARKLWELRLSGAVRKTYFRSDTHEAVLLLECPRRRRGCPPFWADMPPRAGGPDYVRADSSGAVRRLRQVVSGPKEAPNSASS